MPPLNLYLDVKLNVLQSRGSPLSIQTKNKLLSEGNSAIYKLYRNKILTLTRLSKKLYLHNYFQGQHKQLKADVARHI